MSDNVYLGGNAAILQSIVDGTPYDAPIQSPIEALLLEVKEVIEAGGGGGTTNYNSLTNKPQINGEELKGDLSGAALKLLTISNTMPAAVADLEGQQLLYVGDTKLDYILTQYFFHLLTGIFHSENGYPYLRPSF